MQDLLLASSPSVLGLPRAFALTDPHDFLSNEYGGLTGFEAEGVGRVRVRAVCEGRSPPAGDRRARLAAAVERGLARFGLDLLPPERSGGADHAAERARPAPRASRGLVMR